MTIIFADLGYEILNYWPCLHANVCYMSYHNILLLMWNMTYLKFGAFLFELCQFAVSFLGAKCPSFIEITNSLQHTKLYMRISNIKGYLQTHKTYIKFTTLESFDKYLREFSNLNNTLRTAPFSPNWLLHLHLPSNWLTDTQTDRKKERKTGCTLQEVT